MVRLAEIRKQAIDLSEEEREGLVAYLHHSLSGPPSGPDDAEVARREEEMDPGSAIPISRSEFLAELNRR